MPTSISDYNYVLPLEQIAQTPASPRESAKLMVVSRATHTIAHQTVADLHEFFRSGDVLVVNNTKVFKARLNGTVNHANVELFLVRPWTGTSWMALAKPARKLTAETRVHIADDFVAEIIQKNTDGTLIVDFGLPPDSTMAKANIHGSVPVPPYIKTIPQTSDYQTSYAKHEGSVAAPTAGFHFTPAILDTLKKKGVTILEITLHVGLGTFLPIKSDTLEEHHIHTEWVHLTNEIANTINSAKNEHRRIIAVGTTTVRTLEGVAALHNGKLVGYTGDIGLFIMPGFEFQVIDAIVTNFHLPKSTLIVLVSAFAGREFILSAYNEAVSRGYRFYSFGDAMLIL